MIVLKATEQQKNKIEGLTSGNNLIRFVEDGNGDWVVGKEVLTDPDFASIKDELSQLQEVKFKPKIVSD